MFLHIQTASVIDLSIHPSYIYSEFEEASKLAYSSTKLDKDKNTSQTKPHAFTHWFCTREKCGFES